MRLLKERLKERLKEQQPNSIQYMYQTKLTDCLKGLLLVLTSIKEISLVFLFVSLFLTLSNSVYANEPVIAETNESVNDKIEVETQSKQLNSEQIRNTLIVGSYQEKSKAIEDLTLLYGNASLETLNNISNADLFYSEESRVLYKITKLEDTYLVTELSQEFNLIAETKTSVESKSGFKKVRINNRLRSQLNQLIAAIQISDSNKKVRKEAVSSILKKLDPDALSLIEKFREKETDSDVLELMDIALAVGIVKEADEQASEKLSTAIVTLSKTVEPVAINTLNIYIEDAEDFKLRKSAQVAVKKIEVKQARFKNLETLYFGLSLGSVLVLAGIGLAITFGVMGVINMAHGELIMIGAYTTFIIQQIMPNMIAWSIIVAIPSAFIVSALVGILMERLVIRHLYGRPLETLLATFGISLILQQAVRSIFSPLNRTVITPEWMSGMLEINSIFALTWNRLYIIIFCLIVFSCLLLVMKKSALGLNVRAVSQNRNMARAMGVRSERVDILTFGLGSGIAGIAGVALSLLTNVGPNLGQSYIIDSFIVVVFGGVGNLLGTLVAGMSLGIANKILEPWAGAVLAKIIILFFIVLFIQKRPQGLFPQRGRAAED
jgi:urea transport system permease protein